jgi:Helicase associated domain
MTTETCEKTKEEAAPAKGKRVSFDGRLKQCKEFAKQHGHCKIPTSYKENKSLGVWVQEMRRNFKLIKTGQPPRAKMTDDQIASLDEIGFEWNFKPDPCAPESDAMWEQNFKRLKDYKDEHGDFDIPIEGEMGDLGKWARVQRNQNNLRETKRKCFITKDRIKKLSEITFDWEGSRKIDWKKAA